MSELLREVDDAIRAEKVEKFIHEHGKIIIAFIVLTIALTGAFSFYKYWNIQQKEKSTAALIALQESPDFPENVLTADLKMKSGVRGLAYLSGASAFLEKDMKDEALTLYTKAAQNKGVSKDLRQLATIMQIRLTPEKGEAELEKLQPIWADASSPWQSHARLDAAVISADTLGDLDAALAHLNDILKQQNLPDTFYSKVEGLSHIYSLKQQQKTKDTKL